MELAIKVRVKKLAQVVAVSLCYLTGDTVVPHEIQYILRSHKTGLLSVQAVKSRLWLKIAILCEKLSLSFDLQLVVSD